MDLHEYILRLVERYNNPPRPHLPSAVDAARGINDPGRAWQHILQSGLLPESLAQDHRRRYGESAEGQLVWPKDRPAEHPQPTSIGAILTIAADPSGFLEAEKQAHELARRLAPWTAVCNGEVVWYFTDNPYRQHPHEVVYLGLAFHSAADTVDWTLSNQGIEPKVAENHGEIVALPLLVQQTVAAWEGWKVAVSRNMAIREPRWPLDLSKWPRFADLENPFEPLLNLWCTGYRLVCDFDKNDPTIRLYAKPVLPSA